MAHDSQKDFCNWVKSKFPEFFKNKRVADFGSLDINGSNLEFFEDCEYIGIDLGPGKNVHVVSKAHEYAAPDGYFDTVCTTEMLEHDQYIHLSLPNMLRVLKPGGLFLLTCAGPGRPEHGTRRTDPYASPFTSKAGDWGDYYKNVDETMFRSIIDVDATFSEYKFDLLIPDFRFYGIKKML